MVNNFSHSVLIKTELCPSLPLMWVKDTFYYYHTDLTDLDGRPFTIFIREKGMNVRISVFSTILIAKEDYDDLAPAMDYRSQCFLIAENLLNGLKSSQVGNVFSMS